MSVGWKEDGFAIVGGDLRQVYAGAFLREKGYEVRSYGLAEGKKQAGSLKEALEGAKTVLAPIPLSADRKYLNQKSGNPPISLEQLIESLESGQEFFGGCVPEWFSEEAGRKGVRVTDLMRREEIALYNTIATAEGAVAEAVRKSPRNLRGSVCLVLGYGRCAQTLASCLRGMGGRVSICVRNPVQRARAAVFAERAFLMEELGEILPKFSFIFNTVPAVILNRELLARVSPSACMFDLASAPGGIDFEAAEELGASAWLLPGLPGRYAPASSAEALVDFILNERNGGEFLCH